MPPKVRELVVMLRQAGFVSRTATGTHTFRSPPLLPRQRLSLAGRDRDDAKQYQERQVREALAILRDVEETEG